MNFLKAFKILKQLNFDIYEIYEIFNEIYEIFDEIYEIFGNLWNYNEIFWIFSAEIFEVYKMF